VGVCYIVLNMRQSLCIDAEVACVRSDCGEAMEEEHSSPRRKRSDGWYTVQAIGSDTKEKIIPVEGAFYLYGARGGIASPSLTSAQVRSNWTRVVA
jgi:hypothetical protein